MGSANRRRHVRVRPQRLVAYLGTGSRREPGVVENLSVGGAYVKAARVLPAGTTLQVELFHAETRTTVKLSAWVVVSLDEAFAKARRMPTGMGLRFERLSPDQAAGLAKVMGSLGAPASPGPVRKREHRRISSAELTANVRSGGEVVGLFLKVDNVSSGGLFLEWEDPIPVASAVDVELMHPRLSRSLILTGEVVGLLGADQARAKQGVPGAAIRFDGMVDTTQKKLRALLSLLEPKGGESYAELPRAVAPPPSVTAPAPARPQDGRTEKFQFDLIDLSDDEEV